MIQICQERTKLNLLPDIFVFATLAGEGLMYLYKSVNVEVLIIPSK